MTVTGIIRLPKDPSSLRIMRSSGSVSTVPRRFYSSLTASFALAHLYIPGRLFSRAGKSILGVRSVSKKSSTTGHIYVLTPRLAPVLRIADKNLRDSHLS